MRKMSPIIFLSYTVEFTDCNVQIHLNTENFREYNIVRITKYEEKHLKNK